MLPIEKFSFGMGDRFARQGRAQLEAVVMARKRGIEVTPIWNKSNREHTIVKSDPNSVRAEADQAVRDLAWTGSYHVDADHVNLKTVDRFIASSDFYTIDVADFTGRPAPEADIAKFLGEHDGLLGTLNVPGLTEPLEITIKTLEEAARKFLLAMQEAGRVHRHIVSLKGENFITEVSVDETDTPQTPTELFLILAMLAAEKVPVQTIAPKFTGRFNKGVDYVGDLAAFEKEFEADLRVLPFAVHSGSDKFSLYPIINRLVKKHGAGLHVKTAGTTWLSEVIGLAKSGGEGLAVAREIYLKARARFEELAKPYAAVIDIDPGKLPEPEEVARWSSGEYVRALSHDPTCSEYSPDFRQLIHVAFKIAAEMGERYLNALEIDRPIIAETVTENLFERHIKPIFA
jgi:hypothetical protein